MVQRVPAAAMIIPFLRYRDAAGSVEWLQRAFGFEAHCVDPGSDGTIAHAELRLGGGFVMLGTLPDDALDLVSAPSSAPVAHGIYIALDDVEAHYARARAAGAVIVQPLRDTAYGSREYSARDLEGYYWSFGTYRPA